MYGSTHSACTHVTVSSPASDGRRIEVVANGLLGKALKSRGRNHREPNHMANLGLIRSCGQPAAGDRKACRSTLMNLPCDCSRGHSPVRDGAQIGPLRERDITRQALSRRSPAFACLRVSSTPGACLLTPGSAHHGARSPNRRPASAVGGATSGTTNSTFTKLTAQHEPRVGSSTRSRK